MYGLTSSEDTAWEPSAPYGSMLWIAAFKSPRTSSCEAPAEAAAFLAMSVKTPEKFTFACTSVNSMLCLATCMYTYTVTSILMLQLTGFMAAAKECVRRRGVHEDCKVLTEEQGASVIQWQKYRSKYYTLLKPERMAARPNWPGGNSCGASVSSSASAAARAALLASLTCCSVIPCSPFPELGPSCFVPFNSCTQI